MEQSDAPEQPGLARAIMKSLEDKIIILKNCCCQRCQLTTLTALCLLWLIRHQEYYPQLHHMASQFEAGRYVWQFFSESGARYSCICLVRFCCLLYSTLPVSCVSTHVHANMYTCKQHAVNAGSSRCRKSSFCALADQSANPLCQCQCWRDLINSFSKCALSFIVWWIATSWSNCHQCSFMYTLPNMHIANGFCCYCIDGQWERSNTSGFASAVHSACRPHWGM